MVSKIVGSGEAQGNWVFPRGGKQRAEGERWKQWVSRKIARERSERLFYKGMIDHSEIGKLEYNRITPYIYRKRARKLTPFRG
ncbi:hypothetical protein MYX07_01910 [Patescibacteria group bacterium AH-259-L07]|nr:hypothetical protein [Patescibacteria group bacterium AH-259-L07]